MRIGIDLDETLWGLVEPMLNEYNEARKTGNQEKIEEAKRAWELAKSDANNEINILIEKAQGVQEQYDKFLNYIDILYLKVYTKNLAEDYKVYIDNVHIDTSIKSRYAAVDSIKQDTILV